MKNNRKFLAKVICLGLLTAAVPAYAAGQPDYFDWRLTTPTDWTSAVTKDIVADIRFQNPFGNCWSFPSVASMETSLNIQLKKAGVTGYPVDMSERYLSWLTYAPPLNGGGDGFVFYKEVVAASNYKPAVVFNQGDNGYQPVATIIRYGFALESEYPYTTDHRDKNSMAGVSLTGRGAGLHDVYDLKGQNASFTLNKINENKDYYKELIKNYGVLRINAYLDNQSLNPNVISTTQVNIDHSVALIGWDDTYTMQDSAGVTHTGAWILRNSWSTMWGDDGYGYLSYDDVPAISAGVYMTEADTGRYTAINTVTPSGYNIFYNHANTETQYQTASKLTSGASQMLKAVGIFVPGDSMTYKIEVSLKGDTPAEAKVIYTQSGTFGQDGTAKYGGYRTVDFNKFVYLPGSKDYMVLVTLTSTDGKAYQIPLSLDKNQTPALGTSFIYDSAKGAWMDVTKEEGPHSGVPLFALNKYSQEANGDDFTVVSLNDNGVGGSGIYLGKKGELYTSDFLHPNLPNNPDTYRDTLSNMTVELTKGLTDSVYGGVISGEGSVTKTGDGILALSGANTYTGATNVNAGSFALTGSLTKPGHRG
jgi:autotransporter-associated beta strand protein